MVKKRLPLGVEEDALDPLSLERSSLRPTATLVSSFTAPIWPFVTVAAIAILSMSADTAAEAIAAALTHTGNPSTHMAEKQRGRGSYYSYGGGGAEARGRRGRRRRGRQDARTAAKRGMRGWWRRTGCGRRGRRGQHGTARTVDDAGMVVEEVRTAAWGKDGNSSERRTVASNKMIHSNENYIVKQNGTEGILVEGRVSIWDGN
uniref:Uncharacterized protein n=1 Tax=Arundo donax TaxID=35708 RepID=A0A0A9GUJ4_ARUDO